MSIFIIFLLMFVVFFSLSNNSYNKSKLNYENIFEEEGLKEEEIDLCMNWAFGDSWRTMRLSDSNDEWNKRHSDLFIINGSDLYIESMKRIAIAWKEFNK